jgi:hypothetical protein
MGNQKEHRVVVSLVSERDYETVQAIIAWPIRMAGIFLAAVLFGFVIPAIAIMAYTIFF